MFRPGRNALSKFDGRRKGSLLNAGVQRCFSDGQLLKQLRKAYKNIGIGFSYKG